MKQFDAACIVLAKGVEAKAFPTAILEVGTHNKILCQESFGTLTGSKEASDSTIDTVFDLASLTKVIATSTLAMTALDLGLLNLNTRISEHLKEWRGIDRDSVTITDLLEHSSGLTAHLPFFRDCQGRKEFERAICTMPLEYRPRSKSIYSDLGFILLGFILEDLFGCTLDSKFEQLIKRFNWGDIRFCPPGSWRDRTAPTGIDPWRGRLLVGEVQDENAWALGGVAGHSGLFGTAVSVGNFARSVLNGYMGNKLLAKPATITRFTKISQVVESSRALGWDTMRTTSSCGRRMSLSSIGHTGFTGTSLWIDLQSDVYIVLLTNRVYPSKRNEAVLQIRPALHDAVMKCLEK